MTTLVSLMVLLLFGGGFMFLADVVLGFSENREALFVAGIVIMGILYIPVDRWAKSFVPQNPRISRFILGGAVCLCLLMYYAMHHAAAR